MTPFFSIIIPTFNSEETLDVALSSIVKQTYRNIEILIIDGLSTDTTLEIAKRHQKEFPNIIIKSEKDNGIYDAMNKGISLAKGDWLYFMGSDDSLYENNVLNNIFFNEKINTSDIIYGDVISPIFNGRFGGEFSKQDLEFKNICHQSLFFNKVVFKKISVFNLKYELYSDWHLNIKCFFSEKIVTHYINQIIANYGAEGLSSKMVDNVFYNDKPEILFYYGFKQYSYSKLITLCTQVVKNASTSSFVVKVFFYKFLRKVLRLLRKYSIFIFEQNK